MEHSGPLYLLSASVNSRKLFLKFDFKNECEFIIDTGSLFSILPVKTFIPDEYTSGSLLAANQTELSTYGTKTILVDFMLGEVIRHTFIVAAVQMPIIGIDFISKHEIVIDVAKNSWYRKTELVAREETLLTVDDPEFVHGKSLQGVHFRVRGLLRQFHQILDVNTLRELPKHDYRMRIELNSMTPVFVKPRKLPLSLEAPAQEILNELEGLNIMIVCSSPYNSPGWLVPKPDKSFRFVVDFRLLNKITVPSHYPVPSVTTFARRFRGKNVFSKVDLKHGFYSLPLAEDCWKFTATTVNTKKQYCFTRCVMGLCTSTSEFQKFMAHIFEPIDEDKIAIFVDDVIFMTNTVEEHVDLLGQAFSLMRQFGLVIKIEKCTFLQSEIVFLGHCISVKGILPLTDRVQAIKDFPLPETIAGLRRWCGLIAYSKSFIPRAAEIMCPIYSLLKGAKGRKSKKRVIWNDAAEKAFRDIKTALSNATSLAHPLLGAKLHLYTDSSTIAAAATLEQEINGEHSPLGYFSKSYTEHQRKFSIFTLELLAAKWAIKYFEYYLKFQKFTLHCDNSGIVQAARKRDWNHLSMVDYRCLHFILENTQDIVHVKGELNPADVLSRPEVNLIIDHIMTVSLKEIAEEQSPEFVRRVMDIGKSLQVVPKQIEGTDSMLAVDISKGVERPIVPDSLRYRVFASIHGLAHQGLRKTLQMISERYIWLTLRKDVADLVAACIPCGKVKTHRKNKAELQRYPVIKGRLHTLNADIVGPLIGSVHLGRTFRYLVTFICRATRWIECVPTEAITAQDVISAFLSGWVQRWGFPVEIITDRGSQFRSREFQDMLTKFGVKHNMTVSYHPQSNGLIESFHSVLKRGLKAYLDRESWVQLLPLVLLGIRASINLNSGYSMAEQLYGHNPRLPNQFFECDMEVSEQSAPQIRAFNEYIRSIPLVQPRIQDPGHYLDPKLESANFVYLRNEKLASLQPTYCGPFKVIKRHRKTFVILYKGAPEKVSVDRLKAVVEYPFNLLPITEDFLLNLRDEEIEYPSSFEEIENTVNQAEVLDDSQALQNTENLQDQVQAHLPQRTRRGRVVRLPRRYDDYVA